MSNETQSPEAAAESEVSNPYVGCFGDRNGIKVPWVRRAVVRGTAKNTPYITLDYSGFSGADLVKAFGEEKLKELIEAKMNVAGRAICQDIIGEDREKAGYTVDNMTDTELQEFQNWADGKVEDRTPLADLRKQMNELVLKGDLEDPEVLMQLVGLKREILQRQRK